VRDLVSWNKLIDWWVCAEGAYLRRTAENGEVRPDKVTLIGVVSGYSQLRDLELGRRLRGYMESCGVRCKVRMVNLLMDMHVRFGDLERAKSVSVFGRTEQNGCFMDKNDFALPSPG
jgi:hypothetical protein